jgi:selenocysteine lyase/cysteine desulfurase
VAEVRRAEMARWVSLRDGLRSVDGLTFHGPEDPADSVATISLNVDGRSPSEVAHRLDRDHDIQVRGGLHCAPEAHRTIGTFPTGTVRLSPGAFTTAAEVDQAVAALTEITRS